MKNTFYKDIGGKVYSLNPIQNHKDGLTKITEQEALALTSPTPTTEQTAAQVRAERDAKIEDVRWRIERHKDELELGNEPLDTLEPLLRYVQALRDVPQQAGFPEIVEWPVEP